MNANFTDFAALSTRLFKPSPGQVSADLAGELGEQFTLRDVYRQGRSGLSDREDTQKAADVLIDFDWLRTVEQPTEGRSRMIHVINPQIFKKPPAVNRQN